MTHAYDSIDEVERFGKKIPKFILKKNRKPWIKKTNTLIGAAYIGCTFSQAWQVWWLLCSHLSLAKLTVTLADFPFLMQIHRHNDKQLQEYATALQTGAPWPQDLQ